MTIQFGRSAQPMMMPAPTAVAAPGYDLTEMKQVIAKAQTLNHTEATQVTQYVLQRYDQRTRLQYANQPQAYAAAMGERLFQTMARMADRKEQRGTAVADQIAQDANTQYLGSCFNAGDQRAALTEMLAENPLELLELAKGLMGEPADIAQFLLKWQWKAHKTGESTAPWLPQWHPVPGPSSDKARKLAAATAQTAYQPADCC